MEAFLEAGRANQRNEVTEDAISMRYATQAQGKDFEKFIRSLAVEPKRSSGKSPMTKRQAAGLAALLGGGRK